jgi:hypothetical protein
MYDFIKPCHLLSSVFISTLPLADSIAEHPAAKHAAQLCRGTP